MLIWVLQEADTKTCKKFTGEALMGKWEGSQRRLVEPSDSGACLTPKWERGEEGIKERRIWGQGSFALGLGAVSQSQLCNHGW